MLNIFKKWWRKRSRRLYFKKHRWHLLVDIFLLSLIIVLIVGLIIISQRMWPFVDTTPVPHIIKIPSESEEAINLIEPRFGGNIFPSQVFNFAVELENPDLVDMEEIDLQFLSPKAKFRIVSGQATKAVNIIEDEGDEETVIDLEINDLKSRGDHLSLDFLRSGQKIKIEVSLTATPINGDRSIDWDLIATYKQKEQKKTVRHELTPLGLITELTVDVAAYYHSEHGDQLGVGPLPPVLGLPTNYWLFFKVDNNGNQVKNFTLTARLAPGLSFGSGRTISAGDLIYDETTRRLTWTIAELSELALDNKAGFDLQLIPTAEQVGQTPILLSKISYIATDVFTGEQLSGTLADITTDLSADKLNQGQGVVVLY